jgi:6-phosphogluconate dehydrogenase
MQLAMIGLGRMGANMRDRLVAGGHEVLGYDQDRSRSDAENLVDLVARLARPRHVWVMVPAGAATRFTIEELATLLEADDLVIDGGNSKWSDDAEHARILAAPGVRYLDCGVSGGVWGREYGYGLMVGGDEVDVARMMPAFDTLRPEGPRDLGFSHAGGVGAGHYAKMVHNGIEYGLMQAYAEGYELLSSSPVVSDVAGVVRGWSRGTVIRSWLLELLVAALEEDPGLSDLRGVVADSGEGRWTVDEAVVNAVPVPVISAALFARFASRQDDSPAMRAVAALREQFGGHAVEPRTDR